MSDFTQILEKVLELKVDINQNAILIKQVQTDVDFIKEEDREQNRLLAEHIQGVHINSERLTNEVKYRELEYATIQKIIAELQVRVEKAEFVPVLMSGFRKALLWITPVLVGILSVYAFWDKIIMGINQ